MTKEEALNIIRQACASVTGNLETHNQIQTAILTVEKLLEKLNLKK